MVLYLHILFTVDIAFAVFPQSVLDRDVWLWSLACVLSHVQVMQLYELCSLTASSVLGISQAKIPEWVALSSSGGSYQLKIHVSYISALVGRFFTTEPPGKSCLVMMEAE